MAWNMYPYTDNHELNLDWFLNQFKKILSAWENIENSWEEYKKYVNEYFEKLNVQNEIDDKIDDMVESGEFLDIIGPTVILQTTLKTSKWLADHIIREVGYVLDTTLTVSGAAADAKTTGDRINGINSSIDNLQNEIDTLNDGGLNLKDSVIAAGVENWLNDHPEATTTVTDNSITYSKLETNLKTQLQFIYNNVSDMKADSQLISGVTAQTKGFYNINDGGCATYIIRSPKNGEIINNVNTHEISNGLVAELVINGEINLLSCGLISDYTIDQYTRFFNIFHALSLICTEYYLPAGYYITSDVVVLPPNSTLRGDGADTIIYYSANYTTFGAGLTNGGDNVIIKDITIDHKGSDNMWQTKGAVLGGIGFSTIDFDSWTGLHQTTFNRRNTKSLRAENIYSDSFYPLQTEPDSAHSITNVIYNNIYAPNGMVSIWPVNTLDNVKLNNITSYLIRIGQGTSNSNSILISNVFTKTAAFSEKNIVIENIIVDSTGVTNFTRYDASCFVGGDNVKINNALIKNDDENPFFNWGLQSSANFLILSNSTITGFEYNINSPYAARSTYVSNCNLTDGSSVIRNGKLSNVIGDLSDNSVPNTIVRGGFIASNSTINLNVSNGGILYIYRKAVTNTPIILLIDKWHELTYVNDNPLLATITISDNILSINNANTSNISYTFISN